MQKRTTFFLLFWLVLGLAACRMESSSGQFVPPPPLATETQPPAPTASRTQSAMPVASATWTAIATATLLDVPTSTVAAASPDCSGGWTRLTAGGGGRVSEANSAPNRVRNGPSVRADVIAQIPPGTTLRVLEGPVCADGLVFWRVENFPDPGTSGWTAEGDGNEYWLEPFTP